LVGESGSGKTFLARKLGVEFYLEKKKGWHSLVLDLNNFETKESFVAAVKGFSGSLGPSSVKIIILDNWE
jgi:type II secretory pathway predicted ATPase ExeA